MRHDRCERLRAAPKVRRIPCQPWEHRARRAPHTSANTHGSVAGSAACGATRRRAQSVGVANPEHVEIVRQGRDAVERWRGSETDRLCEALGYDDADAKLDLTGAKLRKIRFRGTHVDLPEVT
jgi:hypothetical protein